MVYYMQGPQLHNETVQIAKRQVDDDDHDDVSSLEKIEDADDSGEIEFVEPKEALLDVRLFMNSW